MNNLVLQVQDRINNLGRTQKKAIIAYHNNCIDGITSAYVMARKLNEQNMLWHSIAMDYNSKSEEELLTLMDEEEHGVLYVVDFSLELSMLQRIKEDFPTYQVMILDHHKTAFHKYEPELEVISESEIYKSIYGATIYLNNAKSGAGICWEVCNGPAASIPLLIKYVQDWDLWKFEYGDNTRYIHYYLLGLTKSITSIAWICRALEDETEAILQNGEENYQKHMAEVRGYVSSAHYLTIAGIRGLVTECPGEFASDVGNLLVKESGTFGASYSTDIATNKIKWSFRSNNDSSVDVGALAESLGGGGHRNASGVELFLVPEMIDE